MGWNPFFEFNVLFRYSLYNNEKSAICSLVYVFASVRKITIIRMSFISFLTFYSCLTTSIASIHPNNCSIFLSPFFFHDREIIYFVHNLFTHVSVVPFCMVAFIRIHQPYIRFFFMLFCLSPHQLYSSQH